MQLSRFTIVSARHRNRDNRGIISYSKTLSRVLTKKIIKTFDNSFSRGKRATSGIATKFRRGLLKKRLSPLLNLFFNRFCRFRRRLCGFSARFTATGTSCSHRLSPLLSIITINIFCARVNHFKPSHAKRGGQTIVTTHMTRIW